MKDMTAGYVSERSPALAKRGTKQTCKNQDCGNRFYDLKRQPPACPYCGASHDNAPNIVLDFETMGKQQPRKFNRWVVPRETAVDASKLEGEVVNEQTDKPAEIPSTDEELLTEIEDDEAEAIQNGTCNGALPFALGSRL
jgi:hypothetical protein